MKRTIRLAGMALGALALTVACSDSSTSDRNPTAPAGPSLLSAPNATSGNPFIQCGNKGPTCTWETGNINPQKALMREGDVVPFRITVNQDVAKPGRLYEIRLKYSTRVGGKNAYDFITTYDASEGAKANLCNPSGNLTPGNLANVSNYCSASGGVIQPGPALPPLTIPVGFAGGTAGSDDKSDEIAGSTHSANRFIQVFGGTSTSPLGGAPISDPTITYVASKSGDTEDAFLTFRFWTKPGAGAANFIVAWGGHIAQSSIWASQGGGAAQISGSSYHMALEYVNELNDNGTVFKTLTSGSRDLQLSAAAVLPQAELSLAKTSTITAPVAAGDPVNYTVTATNAGDGEATGVTISDNLPGAGTNWAEAPDNANCTITGSPASGSTVGSQVLSCGPVNIAANGTFSVTLVSSTTESSCPSLSNTATASAGNTTVSGSPTAAVTISVVCPGVTLSKTANPVGPVNAGDEIGFDITVANAATAGPATNVVVTDDLPTNAGLDWSIDPAVTGCAITGALGAEVLSCTFPTLAAGASTTIHVESRTTEASCATIQNTAKATVGNGTDPSDQSASVVVQCPGVTLSKTASPVGPVDAGGEIGFDITVANPAGGGLATNVVVTDDLPTNAGLDWSVDPAVTGCAITGAPGAEVLTCTFASLAAGASATVHVKSLTTEASCATIQNTAKATIGNGADPADAVATVVVRCPNVSLSKTASPAGPVSAGDQIGFTITVANAAGAAAATNVVVTDNLPTRAGLDWSIDPAVTGCAITGALGAEVLSCTFPTLAAGASTAIHVKSPTTSASCTTIQNTATAVVGNGSDPSGAVASVVVNCPNLTLTKTPDQAGDAGYSVQPGGTATFTITVANAGPGAASNVVITDTLPAGLVWQTATSGCAIGSVTVGGVSRQRLVCQAGTLAANTNFAAQVSAPVPASFVLDPPSPAGTPIQIDGNLIDDGAGNDWDSVGIDCPPGSVLGCAIDKPTGASDDSFGNGTKEDDALPSVIDGSIPNNKSDLLRFYLATERFETTDYLYLAWQRVQEPTGTTNMDFELNQRSTLSLNGVTPVRTPGDILIKYDLAQGGVNAVLGFHRWVISGTCEAQGAKPPCWGPVRELNADVAGTINQVQVQDPIAPGAPRTLSVRTFGEARINLQLSGIFQPGVCTNFGAAYLKSRSSDSFTAAVKDFIAPMPISVSNCSPQTIINTAWAQADGVAPISNSGTIGVTAPSGTASLFATPTTVHVARADANRAVSTGGAMSSSAMSSSTMSSSAMVAADAFEVGGRREVRRAGDVPVQVAARAGGRTAALPAPTPPAAVGGGPVVT